MGKIVESEEIKIDWGDEEVHDLSGVRIVGDLLVVCDNESRHSVHILQRDQGRYRLSHNLRLLSKADTHKRELDLEGIANDGQRVYVIGSHSRNGSNERQKSREYLFRFKLDEAGELQGKVRTQTLRGAIKQQPLLAEASRASPKIGGLDIEGLACRDGWLFAGFRGPLDGDRALVLKFEFDDPESSAELLRVDLGGLGIRDMACVGDDFFLLAGPQNSADGPFRLHRWNGSDGGTAEEVCDLPAVEQGKPEGLAILQADECEVEFLILHDGPAGGELSKYRVRSETRP